MARRVRWWTAVEVVRNGEAPRGSGSLAPAFPASDQTLSTDTPQVLGERMTCGPAAEVVVYDRSRDGAFDHFYLRLVGSGVARVALLVESAAAPGTLQHWQHLPNLSCKVPMMLNSDELLTIAAASDMTADSSGSPALWSNGSAVTGQVRQIRVLNTSADQSIELERTVL